MISNLDIVIIILLLFINFRISKGGFNYIFVSTLILSINFIGNLILEYDFFTITTLNFLLFFASHFIFYKIFSKYKFVNSKHNSVSKILYLKGKKILWFYLLCSLLLVFFFFYKVGILVFMEDLLVARERLKYGSGIFSRIILHAIPIISGIVICYYFNKKNIFLLLIPFFSIVIIFLTGYRGFIIWTVIYFLMVYNNFERIKIYNFKVWTGFALFFALAVFLTKQYHESSSFGMAAHMFLERIFVNNIYGYNVLINQYLPSHNVSIEAINDLPHTLFNWNFGSEGKLAQLGAELTITLPGMTYVIGGFIFTFLGAIFLGSIAGILERYNRKSNDPVHLAVRTFLLFSFITLINRGYIINFLKIALISIAIMYLLFFIPSKKIIHIENEQ